MEDQLSRALSEAVQEIASTMLGLEINCLDCQNSSGAPPLIPSELSAIVGMTGGMEGDIRLASNKTAAIQLAGALIGNYPDDLDDDIKDGYGELCNMISGGLKMRMENNGFPISSLTPPTIIEGNNHRVSSQTKQKHMAHHFGFNEHRFFVEIFYKG